MSLFLKRLLMDQAGADGAGGGSPDAAAAAAAAEAAAAASAAAAAKKPSDEEARLLKENMKKKDEIAKLNQKVSDAQSLLSQLEELGGLDAIKGLVTQRKTDEQKALEAKGDWERLKGRMAEEHGKEVKTLKDQLAALNDNLGKATGTINDLTIGSNFGSSTFIADELTLTPSKTRVVYGDHFDLVDGEVVGYDKPRGVSNRTAIVDQYGSPVGFDAALRKIVEADPDKDHLLKSKVKVGAGSDSKKPGAKSGSSAAGEAPKSSMDKIKAGLAGLNIPKQ